MKTKAIVDIWVDESMVIETGKTYFVDYVDDIKKKVGLVEKKGDNAVLISIESFNSFFTK